MRLVSAADAAKAAGIRPATLRDWVRRGLLTPYGSPRRRVYCVKQLMRAAAVAKPRTTRDNAAA